MKVLMLGWEFPLFIAGGLGTACYGLTRASTPRALMSFSCSRAPWAIPAYARPR